MSKSLFKVPLFYKFHECLDISAATRGDECITYFSINCSFITKAVLTYYPAKKLFKYDGHIYTVEEFEKVIDLWVFS